MMMHNDYNDDTTITRVITELMRECKGFGT